jgi:hypothetical protein
MYFKLHPSNLKRRAVFWGASGVIKVSPLESFLLYQQWEESFESLMGFPPKQWQAAVSPVLMLQGLSPFRLPFSRAIMNH